MENLLLVAEVAGCRVAAQEPVAGMAAASVARAAAVVGGASEPGG